jgi:hypothetical protein
MASDSSDAVRLARPSAPLGFCWIVYGIFHIIVAIWMLGFAGTAGVMFGTWLSRVPNPYSLMNLFHIVWAGWMVLSAASGIFGVLAGITLLTGSAVSRLLAVLAALCAVGFVPVGTALGAYTLARFVRRD